MKHNKLKPWIFWPQAVADLASGIYTFLHWPKSLSSRVEPPVTVADDFFGINIATSSDERSDQYVLDHVTELGLKHVRLDFTYDSIGGDAERLLTKALEQDFHVLLDIFPTFEDAQLVGQDPAADKRWYEFAEQVFETYSQGPHQQQIIFEIGNTPNRGKWSGFSSVGYINAWSIISPLFDQYDVRIAGPNISDFEPLGNISYLRAMKRISKVPPIHTTNLFVERVVEPEANDHRVLGPMARDWLRLNLVKKARAIDAIGRELGCEETYCTYKCWTIRRLNRWSDNPEQKQADYLMRYMVLAATSDGLNRVYWGPLVCNRDGIIDCGAEGYPEVDNVSHYREIRGEFDKYRVRPAFKALKQARELLAGATCIQAVHSQYGVHHFVFVNQAQQEFHISWCRDGYTMPLSLLYPSELHADEEISFTNVLGETITETPTQITEQPMVIHFASIHPRWRPDANQLSGLPDMTVLDIPSEQRQYLPFNNSNWRGALAVNDGNSLDETLAALLPEALETTTVDRLIRDKRNKVWNITTATNGPLTIKLNRAVGGKRLSYRFLPSKGKRHWDNAAAMLRAGINTPQPVAYFERHKLAGIEPNYYVTEFLDDAFSARDVFTSINNAETDYRGLSHAYLMELLGKFVCRMHDAGIIHRDLSSGNILLTQQGETATPYLIDIGRAKLKGKLTHRERLIDVMRIVYKLDWPDREKLVSYYAAAYGQPVSGWRQAAKYYEFKQRSKKNLKSKLKLKKRK
jgi:tRNA A-37 threonylcarbamoyl transferase component Bud32